MSFQKGRPSGNIEVNAFRLLLQWPLVLHNDYSDRNVSGAQWLAEQVEKARQDLEDSKVWRPIGQGFGCLSEDGAEANVPTPNGDENQPKRTEPPADVADLQEFMYFHEFVQKFIYPKDNAPVRIYRRDDIKWLVTKLAKGDDHPTLHFAVPRVSMHLFDTGSAILTVELEYRRSGDGTPLTLDQVQRCIDYLRRSSPPFWVNETPARVPHYVKLYGKDPGQMEDARGASAIVCFSPPGPMASVQNWQTCNHSDVPVFDHWSKLVAPLKLRSAICRDDAGPWRDPSDERMPINSFIALSPRGSNAATIKQIREADWFRLADAEEPGDGMPYNRPFLERAFSDAFYDRFMPADSSDSWMGTRHVFGGAHYAFVTVHDRSKFAFDRKILLPQFRRHYAQLSLIARFELTTLLAISNRLSEAVQAFGRGAGHDQFRLEAEILEIQDEFLEFVRRYRFTGVTLQTQGAEMFELWRKTLGLDRLFEELRDEVEAAAASVRAHQAKRDSDNSARLADAAHDIGQLAMIVAVAGLVIGLMGTDLFSEKDTALFLESEWARLLRFTWLSCAFLVIATLVTLGIRDSMGHAMKGDSAQKLAGTGRISGRGGQAKHPPAYGLRTAAFVLTIGAVVLGVLDFAGVF